MCSENSHGDQKERYSMKSIVLGGLVFIVVVGALLTGIVVGKWLTVVPSTKMELATTLGADRAQIEGLRQDAQLKALEVQLSEFAKKAAALEERVENTEAYAMEVAKTQDRINKMLVSDLTHAMSMRIELEKQGYEIAKTQGLMATLVKFSVNVVAPSSYRGEVERNTEELLDRSKASIESMNDIMKKEASYVERDRPNE